MAEETKPTLPRPRKSGRPSRGTGVVATNLVNRYTNQSSAENNTNPTVSPKRGRTGITDISSSSTTTNTSNSSEQLVQINKTEQGLLSDIKKILKEHLNFVKRKSDVPRVQLVRKKKLIDDPMEKYTPSALLKRGLDAGKEKIKEKIFGKKTSGINKLAEKKQIGEIASDNGILKKVIPNIISTLGSSIGPLLMLMAKLLIGLIVIAAAAGLGVLLYNLLIKPGLEASEKRAQAALAKPTTKGTDTFANGEKVYKKTENTPEGEKTSFVSESQMKKELEQMPEEKRKEVQESGMYVPERTVTNLETGKTTIPTLGMNVSSSTSIEDLNKLLQDKKKRAETASPRTKALDKYSTQIQDFSAHLKEVLKDLADQISKKGIIAGDVEQTGGLLGAGTDLVSNSLKSLQDEHSTLINRIKDDKTLSDKDKELLFDSNPVTQGGLKQNPDIATAARYAYILPNNQEIELMPQTEASRHWSDLLDPTRGTIRKGVMYLTDAKEKTKQNALNRIEEVTSSNETVGATSANLQQTISQAQENDAAKIKPAQPTAPSGDQLQNQAMQMRAPDMIAAPTPVAGGNTIINNYNTAPAKQPTLLSGGGGDNGGGSATPPDDSGMHAALTKDLSRSASMGNHT